MDMSKYREMFLTETREHLNKMGRLVIALEKDPTDREGIDALFREAHSIKGMAASMGYEHTAELAHHLEDLMDGFRKGGSLPPPAVDRLLAGVDLLEGLLGDLEAKRPERKVAAFVSGGLKSEVEEESSLATPAPALLRVRVELTAEAAAPAARSLLVLKELGRHGELLTSTPSEGRLVRGEPASSLEAEVQTTQDPGQLRALLLAMTDVARVVVDEAVETAAAGQPRRDEGVRTVRVRTELLDRFINLTGELITSRYMLQSAARAEQWTQVRAGLGQLTRQIGDLHHHVLQVRMMPLESVTGRLPRLVRDLCRKTGKEIRFHLAGEEIELDRAILETLADPLVHMVRNAVDHGIEKRGEITVSARREKDMVLVEVADDGRGMDADLIRRKALKKGLLSPGQAKALLDREVLQLICLPGFSTATELTETSGRGVGMDVVKAAVESLGGTLEIRSAPGAGSRMVLKLPLSVAIIQILLVECDGRTLAFPITRVVRTLEIAQREIQSSGRQMVIRLGEEVVPLLSLRRILHLPSRPYAGSIPILVTEVRGRKVGLVVDRFAGQREAFVKTLVFPLDRIAGVTGATVLGDGRIVFIVDPQLLLDERSAPPVAARRGENP